MQALTEKWGEFLISWYSGCEWCFMTEAAVEKTLFPAADSVALNFRRSKISIFDSHQKLAWIATKMSWAADKESSCRSRPDTCLTNTRCTLQPKFFRGLHLDSTKCIVCVREHHRWRLLSFSLFPPLHSAERIASAAFYEHQGPSLIQEGPKTKWRHSRCSVQVTAIQDSWHPGFIARQSLDRKTLSILPKTSTVHTVLRVFVVVVVLDHNSGI